MGECEFCNYDLTEFYDYENLCKVLECPQCKHKFKLGYDESWDAETGEEDCWFWVDEYIEE